MPYMNYAKAQYIKGEMSRLMVIAIIVALIVMTLVTRSLRGVLIPILTSISALIIAMGIIGWLGLYLDMSTTMITVMLAFAVAIAYNIHVYSFFRTQLIKLHDRKQAAVDAIAETAWPVIFSGFTTLAAMMTFLAMNIVPMKAMGINSALAIVSVLISILVITPIMLSLGKKAENNKQFETSFEGKSAGLFERFGEYVLRHSKKIIVVSTIITIFCGIGVCWIEPAFDVERSMGRKVDYSRRFLELCETELGTMYSYDLMVVLPEEGDAKKPENLKKLETLEHEIEKYPLTKRHSSVLDIIKDMNCTLNGNDTAYYHVPNDYDAVAQLLLLYENAGGSESEYWMDYEYRRLRLQIDSVPEELEDVERAIRQLEIEREAIKRENDTKKVEEIGKELAELNDKRTAIKAKWETERHYVELIQKEKNNIETYKHQAEVAERDGDYGRVAELRYGKIREAEAAIEKAKADLLEAQGDHPLVDEEVGSDDVAEIVSRWTGIPVNKMMQSEREKLLHLEDELHKRVVGQDEAITAVSDAIRRSRAGLQDAKRPIGSFIFMGTTGVGKTELAKALAEFLFDDENAMVRIDMSEYQERHTVSRLIGAPPGYVGYEESGQLTEAVRRKPYSVILLDEIEKAHPDVFNILLQVLDDGRLTDNKGRTVDFKNTIVIMTSNIGANIIQENFAGLTESNAEEVFEKTRNEVMEQLKQFMRPEFLNRVDDIIMFKPLDESQIADIVRMQFRSVQKMLAANDIKIDITDAAVDFIAQQSYNPQYGARPVKRMMQRELLNSLSKMILAESVDKTKTIIVDVNGEGLIFRN